MNFADEYSDLDWVNETPVEDLHIWPVTTPPPRGVDWSHFQARLDAFAGFTGPHRNVRIVWTGNLFVQVEERERIQYAYPWVSQGLARVVRRPMVDDDGKPVTTLRPALDDAGDELRDGDGNPVLVEVEVVQPIELPVDERLWEPEFADLKKLPFGIKSYVIEKAIEAWAIQALVPARISGRPDAYELVHWCTEDGTELGRAREVVDTDVEAVKALWDERAAAFRHRHDEEAAPEFWRRRSQARLARILKRRREAAAKFSRHADGVSRHVWGRYLGLTPAHSTQS